MNTFFFGFADELTKTSSHPLFDQVIRGGTLLGKKVEAIIHKIRRGEGWTGNDHSKTAEDDPAEALSAYLREALREAEATVPAAEGSNVPTDAAGASYGHGQGMRRAKKKGMPAPPAY